MRARPSSGSPRRPTLATRLQAIVLVPTFLAAVALLTLFSRRTAALRPFLLAIGVLAVATVAWAGFRVVGGGSWRAILGAYATVGAGDYEVTRWLSFLEWHLGDLFLLTLGVPLLALLVLLEPALRGREHDERARAFLAATLAYAALLTVEVALFASRFVGHLAERQLVTAAPPLFLALGLWLERGAPARSPGPRSRQPQSRCRWCSCPCGCSRTISPRTTPS